MTTISCLDHRPDDRSDRAAILLHGRNRSAAEMRDLAGEMGLLAWRCVFPIAEDGSWYPAHLMDPIEANEPAIGDAVDAVALEVERLEGEGFGQDQILVGGFSQGACVVGEYLLRRAPGHLAALLLSGGLLGPAGTLWPQRAGLAGTNVLITGGTSDPFVPMQRVVETATWLEASGARVRLVDIDRDTHAVDEHDLSAGLDFVAGL